MNYVLASQPKCIVINGLSVELGSALLIPKGNGIFTIAPAVASSTNPLTYKVFDAPFGNFTLDGVVAASEAALNGWWYANAFKSEGGGSYVNAGVSDYVVTGKNMYNKNSPAIIQDNFFYYSNGEQFSYNSSYSVSDFIPVIAGSSYSLSGTTFGVWYDSNKIAFDGLPQTIPSTINAPTGAAFIKVNVPDSIKDTFQFEKGNVQTPYEAYKLILETPDGQQIEVSKISDASKATFFDNVLIPSKNLFDKTAITPNSFVNWNDGGTQGGTPQWAASDYIPVTQGEQYFLNHGVTYKAYYGSNKVFLSGEQSGGYPVTIPVGAFYIKVTILSEELDKAQFEKSVLETEYREFGYTSRWPYETVLGNPLIWATEGDSISASNLWQLIVARKFNLNVVNIAQGGTSLSQVNGMVSDARVANIPLNANIITLLAGTNDWAQGRLIGTGNSTDITDFNGALNIWIAKVYARCPNIRIFLCTTTYGELYGNVAPATPNWDNAYTNKVSGLTTNDYAEAVRLAGRRWNLPVIDFNQECGWNHTNIRTMIGDDGGLLHPNASTGAVRMSEVVAHKFTGLL